MLRKTIIISFGLVFGLLPGLARANSPVLTRIHDSGVINLGYREGAVPFSYLGEDAKPKGFSIDLCGKITDKIKSALKMPDLKVNLVPVTSANRIALMASGNLDLECGTTAMTLGRLQQVNFLPAMFATAGKLLVEKDSGIKSVEDLKNKSVGVTLGTTEEKSIREISDKEGLGIKIVPFSEHTQGMLGLSTDRIDAYTTDDVLLYGLISTSKEPDKYTVVGNNLYLNLYAIMTPRNDDDFELLGRTVITDLMRTGEIMPIYNKWFTGPGTVNMPINAETQALYTLQALKP
jgi:glutamate/aspartate transport system substrate-binding protein